MTILDRYVLKKFIISFFTGILFFTFIMVIFYLKEIIKNAVEKGLDIALLLKLFIFSIGWTFSLSIPMSALIGTILAVGSLNSNSEIIAMRASGVTYFRIIKPLLFLGFFISLLLSWFNWEVVPYCFSKIKNISIDIANNDPVAVLTPGKFILLDSTKKIKRSIFIESINKKSKNKKKYDELKNIQIRKSELELNIFKTTEFIFAENGVKILKKSTKGAVKAIRLFNGFILSRNSSDSSFQRIDFQNGHLDINIQKVTPPKNTHNKVIPQKLGYIALHKEIDLIQKKNKYFESSIFYKLMIEKHKRYALPFSVTIFIFLGFPLGISNRRFGKGMGLGQSIFFIFLYFLLFLGAENLVNLKKGIPIFVVVWLANFIFLIIGIYLFLKKITDISFIEFVKLIKKS